LPLLQPYEELLGEELLGEELLGEELLGEELLGEELLGEELLGEELLGKAYRVPWSSDPKASRAERIAVLQRVVQYLLADAERKERFIIQCRSLLKAFAISGARDEIRPITNDVNLFAAIYGQVIKTERTASDGEDRDEALDTALKQLVSEAISADGVVDVFGDLGLPNPEFSILSPEFLDKMKKGEQTNLQFELMKKVLNDRLRVLRKENIVESRRFSDMLNASIVALRNRSITTAQAIQQLIELAEDT
jgi:type I restriction enzyme, R subunit